MNTYITPKEFAGLVFFEEEHPLKEREASTGTRNVSIYHTAGADPKAIRELNADAPEKIYNLTHIQKPEAETWQDLYKEVEDKIAESQETKGFFVATATTSDDSLDGY